MAIRKDANTLSAAERTEFVGAVLALKASGIYDQFVLRHANAVMTAIHRCPAFLPWHRRFIWDFERELQRVSGNTALGLPYWNWPQGDASASMWNADLLGGSGSGTTQVVTEGPFREGQWRIVNSSGVAVGPLTRAFGRESWARTLPTQGEIDQVLQVTPYDTFPWTANSDPSLRNQIEGFIGPNLHNRGHGWVGGSMLPMTSPNDPIFFLHHCMVDKLWYEWQLRFPNQGYQPTNGGTFGQNLNDPMNNTPQGPIGNQPVDVIDSSALNIEYDALITGTPGPITEPVITQPGTTLIVNGAPVAGSIAIGGDVQNYTFEVTAFGNHVIETTGSSDTVITLSGPDNASNELAVNDDGGVNFNSRIAMNLSAGHYTVRVRLFSATTTGDFGLSVSAVTASVITQLAVNGVWLDAAIAAASESDLYQFTVPQAGDYVVETNGQTDTFLSLFGPDSQSALLADNDDGGFNLNSRISQTLNSGVYFVRVRHFSAMGTGAYQVRVQRA